MERQKTLRDGEEARENGGGVAYMAKTSFRDGHTPDKGLEAFDIGLQVARNLDAIDGGYNGLAWHESVAYSTISELGRDIPELARKVTDWVARGIHDGRGMYPGSNVPTKIEVYRWKVNDDRFLKALMEPYIVEKI